VPQPTALPRAPLLLLLLLLALLLLLLVVIVVVVVVYHRRHHLFQLFKDPRSLDLGASWR
jgi:hypothetical protein